jgi:hypothetical protein
MTQGLEVLGAAGAFGQRAEIFFDGREGISERDVADNGDFHRGEPKPVKPLLGLLQRKGFHMFFGEHDLAGITA